MITATTITIRENKGIYLRWYHNGWHYRNFYSGAYFIDIGGDDHFPYANDNKNIGVSASQENELRALASLCCATDIDVNDNGTWKPCFVSDGALLYPNNNDGINAEYNIKI